MQTSYLMTRDEKVHHFGDGVWLDEPDEAYWVDERTGLPCIALRSHVGTWNGYVGVPRNHPWWNQAGHSVAQPVVEFTWDRIIPPGEELSSMLRKPELRVEMMGLAQLTEEQPLLFDPQYEGYHFFGWDSAHAGDYLPGPRATIQRLRMPKPVRAIGERLFGKPARDVPLASKVGGHGLRMWGVDGHYDDIYCDFVFIRKEATLVALCAEHPHELEEVLRDEYGP